MAFGAEVHTAVRAAQVAGFPPDAQCCHSQRALGLLTAAWRDADVDAAPFKRDLPVSYKRRCSLAVSGPKTGFSHLGGQKAPKREAKRVQNRA